MKRLIAPRHDGGGVARCLDDGDELSRPDALGFFKLPPLPVERHFDGRRGPAQARFPDRLVEAAVLEKEVHAFQFLKQGAVEHRQANPIGLGEITQRLCRIEGGDRLHNHFIRPRGDQTFVRRRPRMGALESSRRPCRPRVLLDLDADKNQRREDADHRDDLGNVVDDFEGHGVALPVAAFAAWSSSSFSRPR